MAEVGLAGALQMYCCCKHVPAVQEECLNIALGFISLIIGLHLVQGSLCGLPLLPVFILTANL